MLKAGSHVRRKRKRKHKEVHTSNANASAVQYASAIEYSKMVDEVDVLVLLFFLFLGVRRIRRRCLIQRNNKSRPKRLWVREIFRKRQLFPFLSQHLPFWRPTSEATSAQAICFFNLFLKITAAFVEKNRIFPNPLERVFFTLRLRLRLRWSGSHVRNANANASANASARKWKIFHFLRQRLCLRLRLRLGSSHVYFLVLALAFAFASLVWTSLKGSNFVILYPCKKKLDPAWSSSIARYSIIHRRVGIFVSWASAEKKKNERTESSLLVIRKTDYFFGIFISCYWPCNKN